MRWTQSSRPSSPWWCGMRYPHPFVFFICIYLAHRKSNVAESFCDTIQLTHFLLFLSSIFTHRPVLFCIVTRWTRSSRPFSPWWYVTRCPHPFILFICLYLAHNKSNGAAIFLCYNSINSFPSIFSPLYSLFLSLLSRFWELEANAGIIENLI